MVLPEQTGYPTHCLGALLTTHRALVTDGHLTAFCSVPLLEADLAATHAVTSMLWAGPALLLSLASGRVVQLLLSGKLAHVCAVGRRAGGDGVALAAATPDRLVLLARRNERWAIVTRKVYVASLVAQAWLTLLTVGHPFGTWPNVRLELAHICKYFKLEAATDVALAEALLAAGCGDVLPRLGAPVAAAGLDPCAHAAASNDWEHATARVLRVCKFANCHLAHHSACGRAAHVIVVTHRHEQPKQACHSVYVQPNTSCM